MPSCISIEPAQKQEARLVVGVDPGLSGALFFLDLDRRPAYGTAIDIPVHLLTRGGKTKREIDVAGLALLLSRPLLHAFVETVNAMPGQGVTSMFAFGRALGTVLGVLGALEIPTTMVSPAQWKRSLALSKGKGAARSRASQLLPHCAFQWPLAGHHDRAEAALLALYGSQQFLSSTSSDPQPSEKQPGLRSPADRGLL